MMQSFLPSSRLEAGLDLGRPMVRVMGIEFRNCLGIAAGIDRTGHRLSSLQALNAGHIEVGTITDPRDLRISMIGQNSVSIIGVNVGSGKPGFSGEVFADYRACLAVALPYADFIVLNFCNEVMLRSFASDGADHIISAARGQMTNNASRTGRRIPLLAKVQSEALVEALAVVPSVADLLDGFVIVGERIDRIMEVRRALPHHGIVSVGGVVTVKDVGARWHAGADLVQIHRAFTVAGAAQFQRIVRDLEQGFSHG